MLTSLKIRNYAIIRQSEINFHSGLSIITGETGAGKSILMGALGLILGERADSKVILQGADKCVVEAHFDIDAYQLSDFFNQNELDYEPQCIIRRELTAAGKSRAFINDTPVNLPVLKALGLNLVDIVSQHETLELNESAFQLSVLDAIANNAEDLIHYQKCFKEFQKSKKYLQDLLEKESKAKQDEDYLNFVLSELQGLDLKIGEQEDLEKKLDELTHAETIQQVSVQTGNLLDGNEQSIVDMLRGCKALLQPAAKHQEGLASIMQRLESNLVDLKDIALELNLIAEKTLSDPNLLASTESRLQAIYAVQKKHRLTSIEELIALRQELERQLDAIGSLDEEIEKVREEVKKHAQSAENAGENLRSRRKLAIPKILEQVNSLLTQVAMPNANFEIDLKHVDFEKATSYGMDEVVFLFSANKGFVPQPINKVASGGELSRLMLCIKSLIADQVKLPTVVFDEIDSGISGEAAQKVANVMREHAKTHQIIAISHLPQIAGKANQHLYVYKSNEGEQTQTAIKSLNSQERIEEIARMLSGENPSDKVLAAARELIGNSIN
ncbi:MAG: DNA repair protein RecN [Bacteroidia bacterium]|jgi:DNA repair protein RecN (Recombination protein N)|nr:DNA repair protein RecN [Bacteroidia bacterium]